MYNYYLLLFLFNFLTEKFLLIRRIVNNLLYFIYFFKIKTLSFLKLKNFVMLFLVYYSILNKHNTLCVLRKFNIKKLSIFFSKIFIQYIKCVFNINKIFFIKLPSLMTMDRIINLLFFYLKPLFLIKNSLSPTLKKTIKFFFTNKKIFFVSHKLSYFFLFTKSV